MAGSVCVLDGLDLRPLHFLLPDATALAGAMSAPRLGTPGTGVVCAKLTGGHLAEEPALRFESQDDRGEGTGSMLEVPSLQGSPVGTSQPPPWRSRTEAFV